LARRPPSPITQPGYRKGHRPGNKGLKLTNEPLTRDELDRLMDTFSRTSKLGTRNRAIAWVMYRLEMKIGQVVAMEQRHYRKGSSTLTMPPATKRGSEVAVPVDPVTREILDEWIAFRERTGVRKHAPFFCTTETGRSGNRIPTAYIRVVLHKHGDKAGIEKRVTPEGLRLTRRTQLAQRAAGLEGQLEAYVDEDAFGARYERAYEKFLESAEFLEASPERHATRVGLCCREAVHAFADELGRIYGANFPAKAGTVTKLRAVLATKPDPSPSVHALLDALVSYWGTLSDLVERQVHEATREKEPLTGEDARRVHFHTMLVMYEVDRTLSRLP
jgi:hypothetical protein